MAMTFIGTVRLAVACVLVYVCARIPTTNAMVDSWIKSEFPNPQRDVHDCGNNGTKSWVCDPALLLTRQNGWFTN